MEGGGADGPAGMRPEKAARTRSALIAAARELFGERGYEAVSLDQLTAAAGVTKGALYHHFPGGKKALLEAAYEAVEAESTRRVGERLTAGINDAEGDQGEPGNAGGEPATLSLMKAAVAEFFEISLDPEIRQIVFLDAPSVLGWVRWREIAADHGLGLVESVLRAAIEAGDIKPVPVRSMAHLLLAAISEGAMVISEAEDRDGARADANTAIGAILDGLAR